MKVAVSGKGGVGKTLVSAGLAYALARKGFKTIAIDADPSPNLALTLGLSPEESRRIVPISENKALIESKTGTGYSGVYRLTFTVDDIVRDYSVRTPFNVNLIVMGTIRSPGSGCTCPANAVVRSLLHHLVVERDEAVIVDMEAGVEHVGRGTAQHVDHMIVVVNANLKSLEIGRHIHDLAVKAGMRRVSVVANKIENETQQAVVESYALEHGLKILNVIPYDAKIAEAELRGETPLKYASESTAMKAIETLCERLLMENA
ncbi:MAG: P-loop NTPase [Candidatus Bathyarchaeota archaeon]|nr:P-loop NTPase [Candidatus Bathyarchaeota archaeon]MCX8177067.1 P-loop NTPase [Candidatus Bathyarchaeota archaeon]MDW8194194.1 P-loop NTPase [Nitrososphaerota archaeon]